MSGYQLYCSNGTWQMVYSLKGTLTLAEAKSMVGGKCTSTTSQPPSVSNPLYQLTLGSNGEWSCSLASSGMSLTECQSQMALKQSQTSTIYTCSYSDGVSYKSNSPCPSTKLSDPNANVTPESTSTIPIITTSSTTTNPVKTTSSTIPTSNNQYPITKTVKTESTIPTIPTSNNQYPITKTVQTESTIPTTSTKISNPVSTAINVIKSKTTAIPNALFNFYSMYRNYLLGLIILAIFVVIIAKGDKKHE